MQRSRRLPWLNGFRLKVFGWTVPDRCRPSDTSGMGACLIQFRQVVCCIPLLQSSNYELRRIHRVLPSTAHSCPGRIFILLGSINRSDFDSVVDMMVVCLKSVGGLARIVWLGWGCGPCFFIPCPTGRAAWLPPRLPNHLLMSVYWWQQLRYMRQHYDG